MEQYIILILAIVCGLILIKKVASCIIRIVIFLAMIAVVVFAYYYFKGEIPLGNTSDKTEISAPANT